jgi:hypothetical protein
MTKPKANPRTRGRKPIPDLARRRLLAAWDRFTRENRKLPAEVRFHRFCEVNRALLRSLSITVGEYQVLKNGLTKARKAKANRSAVLRQRKLYLHEASKFALGLPSYFRSLADPN